MSKVQRDHCKKCGNQALCAPVSVGNGNTAQPCPICGEQNYKLTSRFKKREGGEEPAARRTAVCKRCRSEFDVAHHGTRLYCDSCLSIVRSKQTTARNKKRRETKGDVWAM